MESNRSSIKAFLFDMDGVLIDAKDWHYDALNMALSHFGYGISFHQHLSTFDGLPTRDKLNLLTETVSLPVGLHQIINDLKQKYTLRIAAEKTTPTFCHEYVLSFLKNSGYKLACCSNSMKQTIHDMLSRANILQYFDLILSNEDVEKAKPSPEIYSKAINYFGLKPFECIVVEDNKNGIEAGIAAGAHVIEINETSDVNINTINSFLGALNEN